MSHSRPHDEFLELCAFATAGQLTQQEQQKLDQHLAVCASCREALKRYQEVIDRVIPAAAAELSQNDDDLDPGPNWSLGRAESALFDRIRQKENTVRLDLERVTQNRKHTPASFELASARTWRNVWALYAAGIILIIALGFLIYQLALRHSAEAIQAQLPPSHPQTQPLLEEQFSDTAHERESVLTQIEQRDQTIAELRRQLEHQATEIGQLRALQARLDGNLEVSGKERQDLTQQLSAAQSNAQNLQQKLEAMAHQSSQDQAHAVELEARIGDLGRQLRERQITLDEQQELLARDRDIRELMGARDLYIAEVHDVARTGATNKPYGRVFYTKGKSLIFYAYDLDQQKNLKAANTFQAWGRRGPEWGQALPLGIFYEDNAAKKRWVMKMNDPKVLAQIDAVFVTVEPTGGSQKPSEKRLLFAYLRVDPNHP